ncbi:MAG: hypothetical protein FRX48_03387 [Lasallia pustulata]|uniref:DUF676 domain-containing protein n=1 Tax=Lasallia pustulata TaxID=136370 RepID=A0A5M8PTQ5_9LECA|nr:MAG: hypothetical protein FRX48_03387 [Lasallia pustulata]
MLISARTYQLSQVDGKHSHHTGLTFHQASSTRAHAAAARRANRMLLLHQTGSVKIGEVIRYTVTYTPSSDRIIPSPSELHVKIKNTSAIPLRAAYLHGPYTLYTACYPSTFDPNYKSDKPWESDVPQFEPNLKAGGSWYAQLTVPERIRETAGKANVKRTTDGGIPSVTWVIEISSQVIFSTSAAVHFELVVGRDGKSLDLGTQMTGMIGATHESPGKLQDHQEGKRHRDGRGAAQPTGVFSSAINVVVDDTTSLWNKPALPEWDDEGKDRSKKREYPDPGEEDFFQYGAALDRKIGEPLSTKGEPKEKRRRRDIHLVVLTHGLHSNLGADMLYLKESIDVTARQAREDARKRKARQRGQDEKQNPGQVTNVDEEPMSNGVGPRSGPPEGGQEGMDDRKTAADDDDDEEVIVRGFTGNAVRTERGIQYLGKRLAKYVLSMTYPDQPFLPIKKSATRKISRALTGSDPPDTHTGLPAHSHSSVRRESKNPDNLAYKISSISFIGHSLGGLIQMYAIAYIHKHSPHFFDEIKPINFIAMASPLLGLSNENPIYVKFALDFGLVGRTGQDLGLTWRAPTMVRSGWGAMIGGIGTEAQRAHRHHDPGAKPLLRVLPTGPAHKVLKMFRNRTVYSNVVNDGIVPLRTSCLLFLDWRGLDRVEKARRENGLVGTMAGWGWAEITGANSSAHRHPRATADGGNSSQTGESGDERDGINAHTRKGQGRTVPQPAANATEDDNGTQDEEQPDSQSQSIKQAQPFEDETYDAEKAKHSSAQQPAHPLAGLLSFLRPNASKSHLHPHKHRRIYERSQTKAGDIAHDGDDEATSAANTSTLKKRPVATRGASQMADPENLFAPPKTTFFEAAGDVLNPPLPTEEFLVNPSSRPRTIFHDRVYHPDDIPPPPPRKVRTGIARSLSSGSRNGIPRASNDTHGPNNDADNSGMKVEEKIARAYHKDLSWRKVLVRLEPDAHNNMIVRRMFSNAYGWPVIKHLCDTHFADTYAAKTADTKESNEERAKPMEEGVGSHGEEVKNQLQKQHGRTGSERREAKDEVPELRGGHESSMSMAVGLRRRSDTLDSADWDDRFFEPTDDDDDDDIDFPLVARQRSHSQSDGTGHAVTGGSEPQSSMSKGTGQTDVASVLTAEPKQMEDHEHARPEDALPERQGQGPSGVRPPMLSAGSMTSVGLRCLGGTQVELPSRTRKIDVRDA